jgi:predicted nucleic acid-binding protein
VLVDTSVWVDHLRRGNRTLATALEELRVWGHPLVIGELACGHLKHRDELLSLLETLPRAPQAEHSEALAFLESHQLMGRGLGWIDVHLLASAKLAGTPLWTLDKPLARAALRLGVGV